MNKRNENREGYKETKVGWIPEDWDVKRLDSLCNSDGEYGASVSAKEYSPDLPRYIRITDITGDGILSDDNMKSILAEEAKGYLLAKGDFLFARTGTVGLTYLHLHEVGEYAYAGYLIKFRLDEQKLVPAFLHQYTHGERYWYWVSATARRGGQTNINANEYSSMPVPLPKLNEQSKIAEILSTWDLGVELVRQHIEAKKKLKKGLMQQLLTGQMRFLGFGSPRGSEPRSQSKHSIPVGWTRYKIKQILKRVRNSVDVQPEKIYQEIGIRSHSRGIFHKEPRLGKSLGNKSVFWIEPDCFILNIVFAWEQAVAVTTEGEVGMIASHRFPMYKPFEDKADLDYLLYFFQTPYGKHLLGLASPGGAGRNKTLGQDTFMKLSITLPPIDEQRKIGSLLRLCDQELDVLKRHSDTLRRQKQGLMQKLLTGEVRV